MTAEPNRKLSNAPGPSDRDSAAGALVEEPKDAAASALEIFSRRSRGTDRSPKILIDGNCNVLWQSPDADRLLVPPMPLWIKGGKLQAAPGAGAQTWSSFIEDVGEGGERLLLSDAEAGAWVLLFGWAERCGDRRLIFLKCATSWPYLDVASSGLASDFGLTKSECAVLDQFACLAKPNQIAERLNISVSTVRSHLKQIHTKMSVSSGVQLLRITRAYTDS